MSGEKFLKNLRGIFFVFLLASCVSRVERHGYMFDMSGYDAVQVGVTNKEKLVKLMGSPTLITEFEGDRLQDSRWIYYSEDVKHFLFFRPKIVDRKIVVMSFDEADVVNQIKTIDLKDDNKNLKFAQNQTPVGDHEQGLLKAFFSNVGQVKAAQ